MDGIHDLKILWNLVKETFHFLNSKSKERKNEFITAHQCVNSAFIQTYNYLRHQKGAYIPKPELAEAWNLASAAVMKCNPELGSTLYMKSRFWLDPKLFINLGRANELPALSEIVDEMERLRMNIG